MTENLAQHLVRHRHVGFAAHVITKLRLDHRERRLDIRPLVIVPHEFLAVKLTVRSFFEGFQKLW